jgi:predicted nucleic acid-binding protein
MLADINTIIIDTCSLVNLMNGNHLVSALKLSKLKFVIGPAVYKEVSKVQDQKQIIDDLIATKKLFLWSGKMDLTVLIGLYGKYMLGDGETESIAICKLDNSLICCDDRKARSAAELEILPENCMGSLKILKLAVIDNIIKCTDAETSYLTMKHKGGFLPKNIDNSYFCKAS